MATRSESKTTHGGSKTRLYNVWNAMKGRCSNHKIEKSYRYLGRGITVCDEWRTNYLSFASWALSHGYKAGLEIDRIDNNGNYTPENCRWVTHKENSRNKEMVHKIKAYDEIKCLKDWAEDYRCVVIGQTILRRIKSGWDAEKAITTISRTYQRKENVSCQ